MFLRCCLKNKTSTGTGNNNHKQQLQTANHFEQATRTTPSGVDELYALQYTSAFNFQILSIYCLESDSEFALFEFVDVPVYACIHLR